MKFDFRALIYAVVIEAALVVLAAFGGPHGALGGVPWVLQLPGILLLLLVPNDMLVMWRIAGGVLIQLGLWYTIIAWVRRRRAARG